MGTSRRGQSGKSEDPAGRSQIPRLTCGSIQRHSLFLPPLHMATAGRTIIYGPGHFNWYALAMRMFQIKERLRLQFRAGSFSISQTPPHSTFPLPTFRRRTPDILLRRARRVISSWRSSGCSDHSESGCVYSQRKCSSRTRSESAWSVCVQRIERPSRVAERQGASRATGPLAAPTTDVLPVAKWKRLISRPVSTK
jgi:hypothetical protein